MYVWELFIIKVFKCAGFVGVFFITETCMYTSFFLSLNKCLRISKKHVSLFSLRCEWRGVNFMQSHKLSPPPCYDEHVACEPRACQLLTFFEGNKYISVTKMPH